MKRRLAISLTVAGLVAASPVNACQIVMPEGYWGSAQHRRDVREDIERASVIIDGEVVRAWTPDKPALVRVEHVLKGYPPDFIEVGGPYAGSDCSLNLENVGERRRMILSNGPHPYDLFRDGSAAQFEDRILRSDRRKVWPYFPGTP
ncbi:MAG TPA: hypothetical protein PK680_08930 [Novosphingobium sp.]|nr:hypothetical protein [Novosphingobium sp.]HQA18491.1 hypothetical protein [Novosphingobium sp.]